MVDPNRKLMTGWMLAIVAAVAVIAVMGWALALSDPAPALARGGKGQGQATANPTLSVSPSPFPANAFNVITLSGSGYGANEILALGLGGVVQLGETVTDSNGNFTFSTGITLPPGTYTAYVMEYLGKTQGWGLVTTTLFSAQ